MKNILLATSFILLGSAAGFAGEMAQDLDSSALTESSFSASQISIKGFTDSDLQGSKLVRSALTDSMIVEGEEVTETVSTLEDSTLLTSALVTSVLVESTIVEAEVVAEEEAAQGWGSWALGLGKKAAQWTGEKGLRMGAGYVAVAYGTPYLNPGVAFAGELADKGTFYVVTWATGMAPVGWVAGKAAKFGVQAAGYYVAPSIAFSLGYNAKEIATGAYAVGNAVYAGAAYTGKALYNGINAASEWYNGSADTNTAPEEVNTSIVEEAETA